MIVAKLLQPLHLRVKLRQAEAFCECVGAVWEMRQQVSSHGGCARGVRCQLQELCTDCLAIIVA